MPEQVTYAVRRSSPPKQTFVTIGSPSEHLVEHVARRARSP